MLFYFIELSAIILFILTFIYFKKDKLFLICSLLFAFLFELFGVFFGGYYYSSHFLLQIFNIPIFIVLSWAVILITSYNLVSSITNHKLTRAVLVSISAIALDLVFESAAVFLGFWTWKSSTSTMLLLIDPANFIGWMLVSFCFVYFYEYNKKYSILFAFPVYLLLGGIYKFIYNLIFKNTVVTSYFSFYVLFSIFFILGLFLIYFNYKKIKNKLWIYSFMLRISFILFGLFFTIYYQLFLNSFVFLFVLLGLVIELLTFYLSYKK